MTSGTGGRNSNLFRVPSTPGEFVQRVRLSSYSPFIHVSKSVLSSRIL